MAIEQKPGDAEKQKPSPAGMPEAKDLKTKKGDDKMGAEDEEPQQPTDEEALTPKKPN